MLLSQAEEGRERRIARGRAKQGVDSCAHTSKVVLVDEEQTKKSKLERDVGGAGPVSVTFWLPDGSCDEGRSCHVGGKVMFIESKRMVLVGTEVTIRLTQPSVGAADRGIAEGIVVWICPSDDEFRNRQGFGVSLRGCWPPERGTVEKEVLKGSA